MVLDYRHSLRSCVPIVAYRQERMNRNYEAKEKNLKFSGITKIGVTLLYYTSYIYQWKFILIFLLPKILVLNIHYCIYCYYYSCYYIVFMISENGVPFYKIIIDQ